MDDDGELGRSRALGPETVVQRSDLLRSFMSQVPVSPFQGPWPPDDDVVACGGTLAPDLVYEAYRHGVFPFYDHQQPILWWCPDPRAILPLDRFHVSRRLARSLRQEDCEIRVNTAFEDVMRACDENRADGTWIHDDMIRCYTALHERGHAHSLEVWRENRLVGGVYGVQAGACFAAESMFHRERDMSKVALVAFVRRLRERGFELLDVQFETAHLAQFGCVEIGRDDYLARIRTLRDREVSFA